jgi:hypothetical protein
MSTAGPFLPVPDSGAESDADVLPADDRLELDRVDDGSVSEGDDAATDDVARPALFKTPAPADSLNADELRRDLGLD